MLFIKGEVRKIDMIVTSCNDDENFEIATAKVELYKGCNMISELPKMIEEHSITITLDTSTLDAGYYNLVITYSIGAETMKRKFELEIQDVC